MNNIWLRTSAGAYIALLASVVLVTTDSQGQPGKAAIVVGNEQFIGGIESREVAQTALDTLFGQIHAKVQENERFIIIRAETIYTAPATDDVDDDGAGEGASDTTEATDPPVDDSGGASSELPPADAATKDTSKKAKAVGATDAATAPATAEPSPVP